MVCIWTLLPFILMVSPSVESLIIPAKLNSTVLLPCQFKHVPSQTPHVRWRIEFKVVFERRGEEFYQGEGYEDRVDVPEDELLKGNCALVLKNVRDTDADFYKSYMMVKRSKRSVIFEWNLVQKVTLTIDGHPDLTTAEPGVRTGAPGMMCPDSLIIFISSLLLFIYQ